jgi:hypothetical protein
MNADYHYDETTAHDNSKSKNKITLIVERTRTSTQKSHFIRVGEFLKEFKNDPLYEFKNFEFLKLGSEYHVIGSGAFGDVFLTRNKKNGKYYAIKQVKYSIINNFPLDGEATCK